MCPTKWQLRRISQASHWLVECYAWTSGGYRRKGKCWSGQCTSAADLITCQTTANRLHDNLSTPLANNRSYDYSNGVLAWVLCNAILESSAKLLFVLACMGGDQRKSMGIIGDTLDALMWSCASMSPLMSLLPWRLAGRSSTRLLPQTDWIETKLRESDRTRTQTQTQTHKSGSNRVG